MNNCGVGVMAVAARRRPASVTPAGFLQPVNRAFEAAYGDSRGAQDGTQSGTFGASLGVSYTNKASGPTGFLHSLTNGRTRPEPGVGSGGGTGGWGVGGQAAEDYFKVPRPIKFKVTFTGSIAGNILTIGTLTGGSSTSNIAVGQYIGGTGQYPPPQIISGAGTSWTLDGAPNLASFSGYMGTMNNSIVALAQSPAMNVLIYGFTNSIDTAIAAGGPMRTAWQQAFRALSDPSYAYPEIGQPLPLAQIGGVPQPKNVWVWTEMSQGIDSTGAQQFARTTARVATTDDTNRWLLKLDADSGDPTAMPRVKVANIWDDTRDWDQSSPVPHGNYPGLRADGLHNGASGARVACKVMAELINSKLDLSTDFKRLPNTTNVAQFLNTNPLFTAGTTAPTGPGTYSGFYPSGWRWTSSVAGVTYEMTTNALPGNEGNEFVIRCYGQVSGAGATILSMDTLLSTAAKNAMDLLNKVYRFSGMLKLNIASGNISQVLVDAAITADGASGKQIRAECAAGDTFNPYSPGYYMWWKMPFAGSDCSHDYELLISENLDFRARGITSAIPSAGFVRLQLGVGGGVPFDFTVSLKTFGFAEALVI